MVDENLSISGIPAYTGYNFTKTVHHEPAANIDPSKVMLPRPCTVLITGAGRGLGESMAMAFAKAGASDIVLAARTMTELDAVAAKLRKISSTINVSSVQCDVTSEPDVQKLVNVLQSSHSGRLDVLINNAGFLDAGWQPITASTAAVSDWHRVFDVNVFGVYLVTRLLLPLLLSSPKGLKTVIGTSSMSSHFASPSIAMGMSKLAMNRFMEYLAGSYGAEGLMSYALHPGGVKTKMVTGEGKVPAQLTEMCIDSHDLSAGMAVWLSKEPRPWLSGRYVAANWDVDELLARKDEIADSDMLKFRMVV